MIKTHVFDLKNNVLELIDGTKKSGSNGPWNSWAGTTSDFGLDDQRWPCWGESGSLSLGKSVAGRCGGPEVS